MSNKKQPTQTPFKIMYFVDNDTQEAIDYWNELDAVRGEECPREENVAVFESEQAAKEYLKQSQVLYDLVLKHEGNSENTGFYDVYNPEACEIVELNQKESKNIKKFVEKCYINQFFTMDNISAFFEPKIKQIKEYLKENSKAE